MWFWGFVCVNQRDLRETLGFRLCGLIESSCVLFSRRLRRSRRGMQQAALFRRERQIGLVVSFMWFCCFVVRLRKSARSAGDTWVSSVYIDWVLLCEYSPADNADHAEECSKAALLRWERHLVVSVVLWFVCVNQRDLRETHGVSLCNRLSMLMCLFSRRWRRSRREKYIRGKIGDWSFCLILYGPKKGMLTVVV